MSKSEALMVAIITVLSLLAVTPFVIMAFIVLINLKPIAWLFISLVLLSIVILWIVVYQYYKNKQ